jgi:4-amino-4-deoxy-L-arabinose transferase-like glycosyltransferase
VRTISLILVGAFLIKAAVLFAVMPTLDSILSLRYSVGFADLYDLIANNVAQGIGYRVQASMGDTMIREPGYPLFLAVVFKIGGYHIEAARLANLLLAVGIALMMMRLTRSLTGDRTTALLATLVFLFHPGELMSEARGGIEIVFIFVALLFIMTLLHAVKTANPCHYLVAGLMLGVLVLVRSTPLFFPVFLLGYLFLTANSPKERWKLLMNVAVLVSGMVIVILPWIARNYMLVHEFVPTATVQGVSAQEGQYTCQRFSLDNSFRVLQDEAAQERNELARRLGASFEGYYYQLFYNPRDELAFNKSLLQRVARNYGEHPTLLVRCVTQNLFNFWFLGKTWQVTWLNVLLQAPLLMLASTGVYVLWKRNLLRSIGVMLTFIVYMVAVHVPIIAHVRHSIPVIPFLAILASVSVISYWNQYRTQVQS